MIAWYSRERSSFRFSISFSRVIFFSGTVRGMEVVVFLRTRRRAARPVRGMADAGAPPYLSAMTAPPLTPAPFVQLQRASAPKATVELTIDGRSVSVPEGTTL